MWVSVGIEAVSPGYSGLKVMENGKLVVALNMNKTFGKQ
jgi:hypothetical protein